HLSEMRKSSALCQTIGGWPAIDRGSERFNSSNTGSDCGTGIRVRMRRNFVETFGTATGVRSYSAIQLHSHAPTLNRLPRCLHQRVVDRAVRRRRQQPFVVNLAQPALAALERLGAVVFAFDAAHCLDERGHRVESVADRPKSLAFPWHETEVVGAHVAISRGA